MCFAEQPPLPSSLPCTPSGPPIRGGRGGRGPGRFGGFDRGNFQETGGVGSQTGPFGHPTLAGFQDIYYWITCSTFDDIFLRGFDPGHDRNFYNFQLFSKSGKLQKCENRVSGRGPIFKKRIGKPDMVLDPQTMCFP